MGYPGQKGKKYVYNHPYSLSRESVWLAFLFSPFSWPFGYASIQENEFLFDYQRKNERNNSKTFLE